MGGRGSKSLIGDRGRPCASARCPQGPLGLARPPDLAASALVALQRCPPGACTPTAPFCLRPPRIRPRLTCVATLLAASSIALSAGTPTADHAPAPRPAHGALCCCRLLLLP